MQRESTFNSPGNQEGYVNREKFPGNGKKFRTRREEILLARRA